MIPLILGANPKVLTVGPKVFLKPGKWRFIVEGLIDSELTLYYGPSQTAIELNNNHEITNPQICWIQISKIGSERSINVKAEYLK